MVDKISMNKLPHLVASYPLIVMDSVKFHTSREKYICVNYIRCGLL